MEFVGVGMLADGSCREGTSAYAPGIGVSSTSIGTKTVPAVHPRYKMP